MPIVMGTEYKLSCCCHVEAKKLTTKNYKKRATVLRCDAKQKSDGGTTTSKCGKLLGRDENAAHNILDKDGAVPSKFRPTTKL
jgi:transposase